MRALGALTVLITAILLSCSAPSCSALGAAAHDSLTAAAGSSAPLAANASSSHGRALRGSAPNPNLPGLPLSSIRLPPGFAISVWARASGGVRFFALGQRRNPTIVYASVTGVNQASEMVWVLVLEGRRAERRGSGKEVDRTAEAAA